MLVRIVAVIVACSLPPCALASAQEADRPAQGPFEEAAYEAVLDRIATWHELYPELISQEDIGSSARGKPLRVVRVTAAGDAPVPELFFAGGIHGHEGSERDAMFLVDQLLTHAEEPAIRELLQTCAVLVQPMVNPDGILTHTRQNANAVDLNRNFGSRWQPSDVARTHPGSEAFSEMESQALRDYLRRRENLRVFVDLHRSTSLLIPATTGDEARDAASEAPARALADAMGGVYAKRGPMRFGRLRGLSADWAADELGVTAYAIENPWRDRTTPPDEDPRWLALRHLLETTARAAEAESFDLDSAWAEIAAEFQAACAEHRVVGASLMFVHGNEEKGFATYGHADKAGSRPVDRDTIYHWASITKTFTAITAMQLRDRGKLDLDDRAVDHLPELRKIHDPNGWLGGMTLRHLLSHSAGFRSSTWPWGGDRPWHPHEPTQYAQLVAMLPYTEIEFEPGRRFQYSNPGIVFVGKTIEQLTGEDFEVQVDKNIFRPLEMHRSYFDHTPYHLQGDRSHSYRWLGTKPEAEDLGPDFDTGVTVSNGGLNAPLTDMARYLAFLLDAAEANSAASRVLRRESLEEMWESIVPTSPDAAEFMGLGFFLQEHDGELFVTHTGGQRSFVTFFYVHPASGTGALGAFNTNTGGPVMAKMRRACMERLSMPAVGTGGR